MTERQLSRCFISSRPGSTIFGSYPRLNAGTGAGRDGRFLRLRRTRPGVGRTGPGRLGRAASRPGRTGFLRDHIIGESDMRKGEVTRRSFVAGTAGAAFGAMVVPRHVLGGAGYRAPSETVNVAIVGCGGQGAGDAGEILAGGAENGGPGQGGFRDRGAAQARPARG